MAILLFIIFVTYLDEFLFFYDFFFFVVRSHAITTYFCYLFGRLLSFFFYISDILYYTQMDMVFRLSMYDFSIDFITVLSSFGRFSLLSCQSFVGRL